MNISEERIEDEFIFTDFGGREKTREGRKMLMVECVLKYASGYSDGRTITNICESFGLVKNGKVSVKSIRWAFLEIYKNGEIKLYQTNK